MRVLPLPVIQKLVSRISLSANRKKKDQTKPKWTPGSLPRSQKAKPRSVDVKVM